MISHSMVGVNFHLVTPFQGKKINLHCKYYYSAYNGVREIDFDTFDGREYGEYNSVGLV